MKTRNKVQNKIQNKQSKHLSNTGIIGTLVFSILLFIALTANAQALAVTVNKVEVNGVALSADSTNRLNLERGENLKVKVELTGNQNITNAEIEAFIAGYEYNDIERLSDSTHVFDIEQGVTYAKYLSVQLPSNTERDNYKLRIVISDRYGSADIYNYNLKIATARHSMMIKDIILSPEETVQAGRALLATLRLKNNGEKDEEGIKVEVSIPALEISATHYIDELESDESTTTEEMYMRIPACSNEGSYVVRATATYDEGYERISKETTIRITKGDACESIIGTPQAQQQATLTVISIGADSQELIKGEGGAVYPLTITNNAKNARTFVISADGVTDFATIKFSPSNVIQAEAGSTKTVYAYLSAKKDASAGDKTFLVNVQSDQGLKQIGLKAKVIDKADFGSLKTVFEILMVVLVLALLIFGVVFVLTGKRKNEAEAETTQYPGKERLKPESKQDVSDYY